MTFMEKASVLGAGNGEDQYVGCFVDDGSRDLGAMVGVQGAVATNTFQNYRAVCCDHQHMSLQCRNECFLANSYGNRRLYRPPVISAGEHTRRSRSLSGWLGAVNTVPICEESLQAFHLVRKWI